MRMGVSGNGADPSASLTRPAAFRVGAGWLGLTLATGAAFFRVASERSEIGSALLFGYSAPRLAILFALGAVLGILLAAGVTLPRSERIRGRFWRFFLRARRGLTQGLIALFLLASGALVCFLYWLPDAAPAITARLVPVGLWLAFVSLWSAGFCSIVPEGPRVALRELRRVLIAVAAVTAIGIAVGVPGFVRIRFGFAPDPFDWQPPGMSIHWGQLATALLGAAAFVQLSSAARRALSKRFSPERSRRVVRVAGFFAIWALTAWLWISVPTEEVLRNSYFMEIAEPNGVPYPASDAAYFAVWAESILAGLGLKETVVSRQLFVGFLSLLFRVAGDHWLLTIDLLTGTLALIPALLFLLGAQLHGEGAGAIAAGIAILRELNTLYMAPYFGVSSSKMFLSDLPMLLALLAAVNAAVWAYRRASERDAWLKWAAVGGCFGLGLLIRSQFAAVAPIFAGAIVFRRGVPRRVKAAALAGFVCAAGLVLMGALIRSAALTGSLVLEDASIHGYELTRRFSGDPLYEPTRVPGESAESFSNRMAREALAFIRTRPGETASFVLNHWTKAIAESAMVLPLRLDGGLTWNDRGDGAYQDLENRLANLRVWEFYGLAVFAAIGFWAARRRGAAIPLGVCLVYLLSSSIGRYSGWRFNLPADWFICLFFATGAAMVSEWVSLAFRFSDELGADSRVSEASGKRNRFSVVRAAALIGVMALIGAAPALSGRLRSDRVVPLRGRESAVEWLAERGMTAGERIETRIASASELRVGRLLYPRWFAADDGLTSANPWAAYRPRPFDRLGFVLLNRENVDVVIPIGALSGQVPHRADCLVGGTRDGDALIADFVICPAAGFAVFPE